MWLIARRTVAEDWVRLTATLLAVLFSVALMAGSLQFALRAQQAVAGSDASEYEHTDVLVQPPATDPNEPFAISRGNVPLAPAASVRDAAAVAGDAQVPVAVAGRGGRTVTPPAGAATTLRPWVADGRLNPYRLVSGRAPAGPDEVAVIGHIARAGHLATGSDMSLLLPKETRKVRVVGVVTVAGRGAVASGDIVLATPDVVHRIAGLPAGSWQTLWVKAVPGVSASRLRDDLAQAFGRSATVRKAADVRRVQSAELAGTGTGVGGTIGAIAMVAVFVGLFVVANTFGTLIRQRTPRLALLAAIGATPRQIRRLIRLEALVLGAVASAGGLVGGYGVSEVLTRLFARDGFDISAGDAQFGWVALGIPFAAGILVTQLAARRAGRRASRVAPMQALRAASAEPRGRRWPRLVGALAVFALAWLFFGPAFVIAGEAETGPPGDRTAGITMMIFMGMMVTVVALAILAPFFVGPLGGLVGRIGTLVSGEAGRLARATITRSPRRVSSAASALMLGVALAATTGLLVISVQHRFAEAGADTMTASHAIAAQGASNSSPPLSADVAARVAAVPGVTRAVALTGTSVKLAASATSRRGDEEYEPLYVDVTGADPAGRAEVLRFGGHLRALRPGEVGLSSAFMRAHRVHTGQRITVNSAQGRVTLTVAGRYRDPSHLFADEALVDPATMARLDPSAGTKAVLVRGNASAAALARAVAGVPGAKVYDRAGYVRHAAAATQKGAKVIYGFLGMSLVIALFGMATTVSLSVSERTREFGLLGAVGTTVRQIRSVVRWEAATVVVLGTLLGMATAVGTVALLHAATGSSFIRLDLPWWLLPLVAGGAAAVALTTSAFPARRAANVPILEATGG